MYNRFLTYLLSNDAERCVSKLGVILRKAIWPVMRLFVPLTTPTKLCVIHRADMPKGPVIFASTHGFKEDAEDALLVSNRPCYILIGSLSQVFKSIQGISAWAVGAILVNRMEKESRRSAKEKLIRALQLGANVIIFPEGTCSTQRNDYPTGIFYVCYQSKRKRE